MARKTNYSFEKRQKELAKIKKKEEKRLRKKGPDVAGEEGDHQSPSEDSSGEEE